MASQITLTEDDTHATPSTGKAAVYVKTDGKLYLKDDGGSETEIGAGTTEFADNVFRVQDDGDATKEIAFQASGITTGTTRTITMPDKDITVDDDGDSRPPTAHAATHTNGSDDVQTATAGQKGMMSSAAMSKLDGIEAGADVTDATNVAAAGAVMKTLVDAKGDLIVGTADDTVGRLALGSTDGHVLTRDIGEASGMKWAAASGGTSYPQFQAFADQLIYPDNADWPVTISAIPTPDSVNNGLLVALFDDTIPMGVGLNIDLPSGATNIHFLFSGWAVTAPGTAKKVSISVYEREIPNNAVITSWSSAYDLDDLDIPDNEYNQRDTQIVTFSALGLTAGITHQFEIIRNATDANDTLVGYWALFLVGINFS